MEYQIVSGETVGELETAVGQAIDKGWKPQGGVSVISYEYQDRHGYNETLWMAYQALTRPAKRKAGFVKKKVAKR